MSLQTSSLIVCVFLAQMAAGTGVQFVMERHPDNYFCGHLQCLADFTHTDHDVSTFVEMAIYDITRVNSELRLASVSTFDPDLYVDTTKSSALGCTGTISRLEANLTLQLRHDIDCLYAVYKCQLDLVTVSGHSQVLTEIVTPEYNHSYSRIGQSKKTDWILRNVSLIADKLTERDKLCQDTFTEFKKEVSVISDKLNESDKLWQDKFTELKQEVKQDVSLISSKLNESDKLWQDKFTELKQEVKQEVSLISDKLNESDKLWEDKFTELKQEVKQEVSLISDKLNESDKLWQDKFTELKQEVKQEVSLISGKLSENDKLWHDKFTELKQEVKQEVSLISGTLKELKQEVDSLPKKVSDIIRDSPQCQPLGYSCYRGMPHKNAREKFLLSGKVLALCDTETDGGGWVIIQRRVLGDVDFYRGWNDYKRGFGTPDTDLWIGNDIIYDLTSQGYNELRIDFVYNGTKYFAQYTNFRVADESSNYRLTISGFSGNVRDGMKYHNGSSFSTLDRDNDSRDLSCAVTFHGAWWYHSCYNANLNAAWAKKDETRIAWYFTSDDSQEPLTFTEMKIR